MQTVTFDSNYFYIKGKKERLVSGAIHYFRVPHELWEDRIVKAKQSGLNTIETYFAWNFHEEKEGEFDLSGDRDIDAFFSLCEKHDMYIIARPGPYICSEWDNGAFPAWLNIKPGIKFRDFNKVCIKYIERYFDKVVPIIEKHQAGNGGNVIIVQVENEYLFPVRAGGKKYLEWNRDTLKKRGINVPLIACNFLARPIKGVVETFNWSGNFKTAVKAYRKLFPKNPFFVTEFWVGWFDQWGKPHSIRKPEFVAKQIKELYSLGGMVNYYMYHGGTNFGFYGGRTVGSDRVFMTTSYDCDAPLNEGGLFTKKARLTALLNNKFRGLKPVVLKNPKLPAEKLPALKSWRREGVKLGGWKKIIKPESFEKLGNYFGYGVYKAECFSKEERTASIFFTGYGDRVRVFVNKKDYGVFGRGKDTEKAPLRINLNKGKNELVFFVDNLGRFNYGLLIGELKGLFGPVYLDSKEARTVWVIDDNKNWPVRRDKYFDKEIYAPGKSLLFLWDFKKKKILKAVGEFELGEGTENVHLFSPIKQGFKLSCFVNGKQVYYVTEKHQCNYFDGEITKFTKTGKNKIEYYFEKQGDLDFLREVKITACNNEVKKGWAFQRYDMNGKKYMELGSLSVWKTGFNMKKKPTYPIFLRLDGMEKGQIYMNGHNIGRYWQIGPQREYYLPEPWFIAGRNEIVLFEENGNVPKEVKIVYNTGKFEIVK